MLNKKELMEELKNYDTPSVTNVIATYPDHHLCLGLYNPWNENWYTDQTLRCMFPELGCMAGYAVTCIYGLAGPNHLGLSFVDIIDVLEESLQPTILVIKQDFPPEIAGKVGLSGGKMTTALKSIGCLGVVSDGPSRDINEIRPMRFQYLLTGVCPGHGEMTVKAINVPVSIAGMDVSPGEIVHMDENGACKFPANKLEQVVKNLKILKKEESERMAALSKARTAVEVRAIFTGQYYGED
jgi:regulator of RNase E activity RraA